MTELSSVLRRTFKAIAREFREDERVSFPLEFTLFAFTAPLVDFLR